MSLEKLYSSFLVQPKPDQLDADAGLHYITSLSSVQTGASIISHLTKEAKLYKKKEQKIINSVESGNSLVVEVATTLEFVNGGGVLLPGVDDNFLSDQTIIAPMIHIVNFENDKIKQIRLHWDQATFLKQIGVIGKSGKNWPIRDGTDQIRLIKTSTTKVNKEATNSTTDFDTSRSRASTKGSQHSGGGENLSLFVPKEESPKPAAVASRSPSRPVTRDLADMLAGDSDPVPAPTPKAGVAPKRTFALGEDIEEAHSTPDRRYKSNPNKYSHFEFADEEEDLPPKTMTSKQKSLFEANKSKNWDFDDFATPEKPPTRRRPQEERHFGWSDDELETSPVKPPRKVVPRPDAETHFDFLDDSPEKKTVPVLGDIAAEYNKNGRKDYINTAGDGMGGKKGMYKHDIFGGPPDEPSSENVRTAKTASDRVTSAKNMDTHWSNSTPPPSENKQPIGKRGINIGADGMGGRKGVYQYDIFDDESPPPSSENIRNAKNAADRVTSAKNMDTHWSNSTPPPPENKTTGKGGINIGGDGMGGKKGVHKHDIFADDSSPESSYNANAKPLNQKSSNTTRGTGQSAGNFWDF